MSKRYPFTWFGSHPRLSTYITFSMSSISLIQRFLYHYNLIRSIMSNVTMIGDLCVLCCNMSFNLSFFAIDLYIYIYWVSVDIITGCELGMIDMHGIIVKRNEY